MIEPEAPKQTSKAPYTRRWKKRPQWRVQAERLLRYLISLVQ